MEGTDLSAGLGTLLLIQKHEETLLQKVNVMNLIDRVRKVCPEKMGELSSLGLKNIYGESKFKMEEKFYII